MLPSPPTHSRKEGKLYRHYVSQSVLRHGAGSCPIGRVPAVEIDVAVIGQLRSVFRQPEIMICAWKASRGQDRAFTEIQVADALHQLDSPWEELFPAEQARIVQLLVERVNMVRPGSTS